MKDFTIKIPNWIILTVIACSYFLNIALGIILTILYLFVGIILPQLAIISVLNSMSKDFKTYDEKSIKDILELVKKHLNKKRYFIILGYKISLGYFIFIGRNKIKRIKAYLDNLIIYNSKK